MFHLLTRALLLSEHRQVAEYLRCNNNMFTATFASANCFIVKKEVDWGHVWQKVHNHIMWMNLKMKKDGKHILYKSDMCWCNSCERGSWGRCWQIMGGWRGDRGSYIVSPKPASPSCKGRLGRLPRGGAGDPKGPQQGAANAGMGAFRVEQPSNVRGSRLRIRSPFRKKEKEESRRSFIFAYEREPLEKGEEGRDEKEQKVEEEQ